MSRGGEEPRGTYLVSQLKSSLVADEGQVLRDLALTGWTGISNTQGSSFRKYCISTEFQLFPPFLLSN